MDETKFNQIVKQYQDNLFVIAFNIIKDDSYSQDIVQNVFIKLYSYNKSFASDDHLRNWLIRVTINESKNHLLSAFIKKSKPLDEYINTLGCNDKKEEQLLITLLKLPLKYRIVIQLYYYEEYSVKEIANIIKKSETNVQTMLARGRNKLKTIIMEESKHED